MRSTRPKSAKEQNQTRFIFVVYICGTCLTPLVGRPVISVGTEFNKLDTPPQLVPHA